MPVPQRPGSAPKRSQRIKATKDADEMVRYLESRKLEQYADLFLRHGYSMTNLHMMTENDLKKLRITNRKAKESVLGAVSSLKDEMLLPEDIRREHRRQRVLDRSPQASVARGRSPEGVSQSADGVQLTTQDDGTVAANIAGETLPFDAYTATTTTANECIREAQLYLDHRDISRQWPSGASKMARMLNLSFSSPKSHEPLYNISLGGESQTVEQPCKHQTGYQARFCGVCKDFVSQGMQGQWQYQQSERITVGDGAHEDVLVWRPFEQAESLKIEFAHKRQLPQVKIRGKFLDFEKLRWGKDKKRVRRMNRDTVPFPTLKKKDVVPTPEFQDAQTVRCEGDILELQRQLITDTEERKSRLGIEQWQQQDLVDVLAQIEAIMLEYFAGQRRDIEEEETIARAKIEGPEYDAMLDKLHEFELESLRSIARREMEREAAVIWGQQCKLIEDMEAHAREHVEAEEAAVRANLEKLVKLLNQQCKDMIAASKVRKTVENDGKLRCKVCRKLNCTFHKQPWHNHWRHRGGALDLQAKKDSFMTMSQLMGAAGEAEYDECMRNLAAAEKQEKEKKRVKRYLGLEAPRSRSRSKVGMDSLASGAPPADRLAADPEETPHRGYNDWQHASGTGGAEDPTIRLDASPIGHDDELPPRPASAAEMGGSHSFAARQDSRRPSSAMSRGRSPSPKAFCSTVGANSSVSADSASRLTKRGMGGTGAFVRASSSHR